MFDKDQRLVICNDRYAEMFGLQPELLKAGTTLRQIMEMRIAAGEFPGTDPNEFIRERLAVAQENGPTKGLLEFEDGRVYSAVHQPTADGGWLATFEDITERIQAESELARTRAILSRARADIEREAERAQVAHEHLRGAFDVVPEALVLFDKDDRCALWNHRYEELFGAGSNLVHGAIFEEMLRSGLALGEYPDAQGREDEWLATRLADHRQPDCSFEQRTKSGRWHRVREHRTLDGGSVGVHIDISELKLREASFKLLFESNPLPMWVLDRSSLRFLAVNAAALKHYGYTREQFRDMSLADLNAGHNREVLSKVLGQGSEQQSGQLWQHIRSDQSRIDVAVYSQYLKYEGHEASLAAIVDVTERKRAEDELRRTQNFLDTVLENVPAIVVVKDIETLRYVFINRAAEAFYGVSRDEVIGKVPQDIYSSNAAEIIIADVKSHSGAAVSHLEMEVQTPRNGMRLITSKSLPILDANGAPQYRLTLIEDVTERKRSEMRIAHLAHHDPLTHLPNRAAFNERLAETLELAKSDGSAFAVLCMDLDQFKEANDVFGHAVGDALLCEMSRRMEAAAERAFVARVGGDEFTLISAGDGLFIMTLAERLLTTTSAPCEIEGQSLRIGISIGVALYPRDGKDAATLLANADAALYRAKGEGRLAIRFFEPEMDQKLRERRWLQQDLRSALERKELVLYYQPQARINGDVIGFEALCRWQHPKHGLVSPTHFIPLAEQNGLINQIGEWVLRQACREAASWREPLQIAVNLSPVQFLHGDLPNVVHTILLETGLTSGRLELEITEGVLIKDKHRALAILRGLKVLGVKIIMDDFGTGYSSLSSLQSFPFDKIKIDRSFVSALETSMQSAAIVRSVIGLGNTLGMPVVAEGVENKDQRDFLKRAGCQEIQGFLIGRPFPISSYARVINGDLTSESAAVELRLISSETSCGSGAAKIDRR